MMEMLDLSVAPVRMKEELKLALATLGGLCVMTAGVPWMQEWCVGNSTTLLLVCNKHVKDTLKKCSLLPLLHTQVQLHELVHIMVLDQDQSSWTR